MEFKDVALGLAITGATVAGIGAVAESGSQAQAEWEKAHPDRLRVGGLVRIWTEKNGVPINFRSTATIPHDANEPPNLIPHNAIDLGNGKTAADVDEFYVSDYVLEDGYDPAKTENDPNPTGTWIAFPDKDGTIVRMNLSPKTGDYWKVIAEGVARQGKLNENGFTTTNGENIPENEIGKISLTKPTE